MKKQPFLILLITLFLFSGNTWSQNNKDDDYRHLIDLIERLSFYKVDKFDTLYGFTIIDSFGNQAYKKNYLGWGEKWDDDIFFLSIKGREMKIARNNIEGLHPVAIDDKFIKLNSHEAKRFKWGVDRDFDENYLLGLWLEKKGKADVAKLMLPKYPDTFFNEEIIVNDFGTKYYTAMLEAFCMKRNYQEAIKFGNHLSNAAFENYRYQKQALELTQQLKTRTNDFKTFYIPSKAEWEAEQQKLNRIEQIKFLTDRLKLINCIQPGQPAGISYTDPQFVLPIHEMPEEVSYWEYNEKYAVINPCNELAAMKLNPQEVELLLPYLLDESYIPTYTYHRDFMSGRTLHKLSWVLNDLLYAITDKHFFNSRSFDSLDHQGKTIEVEKIKKWCRENGTLSPEERTNTILNTTTKWADFAKALQTAITNKYAILLPVLERRFNDFPGGNWPSHQGAIARVMFEYGNENYIPIVRKWNDVKDDEWVTLWTSLFLIKHDKKHSEPMKKLEAVLEKCDGISYYPHTIDVLLNLNNKKAQTLAEGILAKEHFQMGLMFDFRLDCIKKLLLGRSDYTLEFLCKKLENISEEEREGTPGYTAETKMLSISDLFVAPIAKLRNEDSKYYTINGPEKKIFTRELSAWLRTQYELFKLGKPSELNLTISNANEPVSFLDAAND